MSQAIHNTVVDVFFKLFIALMIITSLLAIAAPAEAVNLTNKKIVVQTERLEGQLRSSIAFERAFDNENISLDIQGNTIVLSGSLSSLEQQNNLVKFVQSMAPNLTIANKTNVVSLSARNNKARNNNLFTWISI